MTPCCDDRSVSLILPAYNEAATVRATVEQLLESLADYNLEILVIDDGSTDDTARVAAEAGATVIRHKYNKGNGAAVKTGLRAARHCRCAIIDADGQHDPADVRRLLSRLTDADMVVGARTDSKYSRLRGLGNTVLRVLASYLVGHRIPDLTSGLRAFHRTILRRYIAIFPNRFSLPTTSTLALISDGYTVVFEPITVKARVEGTSSSIKPLRDGLKFLTIIARIIHQFNPLKIYLPLGAILLFFGLVWTLRTILTTAQFSAGGIFFLLSGLIVVLMGFQIDQVSALRRQVSGDNA